MACCVCKNGASLSFAGAPVCGESHAQAFYASLRANDQAKVVAGRTLSETKVRYYAIGAAFDLENPNVVDLSSKYKDFVRIGRGGNAQIFRAVSLFNGKTYALKVFSPVRSINSVRRDLSNLIELRHRILDDFDDEEMLRNLPDVYDAFRANTIFHSQPSYVIKMEYIKGRSLDNYVEVSERQPFEIDAWLRFASAAFNLVQTMHAIGMVHGDIKGDNIMVRQKDDEFELKNLDRNFVLIDFGLSCYEDGCDQYVTGTVLFMGPELIGYPFTRQFSDYLRALPSEQRLAMFKSEDVYAMATTLFNALCRKPLSMLQLRLQHAMRKQEGITRDVPPAEQNDDKNRRRRDAAIALFNPDELQQNFNWIVSRNSYVKAYVYLLRPIYDATIGSWYDKRAKAGGVMVMADDARRNLQ